MTNWLQETTPVDTERLSRLRTRLGDAAGSSLDVAYRTVSTPIGELLIAATGAGLIRLAFAVEDADTVLQDLADRVSPRVLLAPRRLDEAARQLEQYLSGTRERFDLPIDLALAGGFRREVLDHLRTIGFGHTESYREVAVATGRPNAVRAVGTACALNPVPLVVPCHRVLRSDGTYGGYRGGPEVKRWLLQLESGIRQA